jgi:transposase-like protein
MTPNVRSNLNYCTLHVFRPDVRRLLYTMNAIEALNSKLRWAIRARGHFPTYEDAMKLLFLVLNADQAAIVPGAIEGRPSLA